MLKRYTKGDKNSVITRINQVSDITIYIPTTERCMDYLYDGLIMLCNNYVDDSDSDMFFLIPAIDFYNVVFYVSKCCEENGVDTNYISAMMGIMKTFTNLKHVSVLFRNDDELRDVYERVINMDLNNVIPNEVIEELSNIYSIDMLEIYLGDMFDQNIIDLINKSFISNHIISNSFLERDFFVTFEFDEYISYINMFVDNNMEKLSMLDEDIIDYFRVFPSIIGDIFKPNIKLYTNYKEI